MLRLRRSSSGPCPFALSPPPESVVGFFLRWPIRIGPSKKGLIRKCIGPTHIFRFLISIIGRSYVLFLAPGARGSKGKSPPQNTWTQLEGRSCKKSINNNDDSNARGPKPLLKKTRRKASKCEYLCTARAYWFNRPKMKICWLITRIIAGKSLRLRTCAIIVIVSRLGQGWLFVENKDQDDQLPSEWVGLDSD